MSLVKQNDSIVSRKSYDFSLAIIKLYKNLQLKRENLFYQNKF